jgi:hypothetical protein
VALSPGQTIEWDEDKAAFARLSGPRAFENFHYRLRYPHAGSQFGPSAWRGEAKSNEATYSLTD